MRPAILALLLLSACATRPVEAPPPAPSRGETLAATRCAVCHAMGASGESPWSGAPPLRDLGLRYNVLSLEHRLTEMNGKPHFDMPRIILDPGDIRDLASYIGGDQGARR